ncbi:MAG TPA: DUF6502 family protein [Deferrisomatales bacterium]|nr:DUF6502 family protein [Deferrisomatales bacterium]
MPSLPQPLARPKVSLVLAATRRILRALVRVLLRCGIPYPVFSELARWTYAEVAAREFSIRGRKQTNSRVAVITGLSRKEVLRLRRLPMPVDEGSVERFHRGARIVSAWVREGEPKDSGTLPGPLAFDGPGPTFTALVAKHGGDVPPRAVLDELLRAGVVERDGDRVRLVSRAYLPAGDGAEGERVAVLGTDVAALLGTIDHNLQCPVEERRLQRRVLYRGVPAAALPGIQALARQRGQALLEELDQILAGQVERGPDPGRADEPTRQVMFGMFWAEEDEASPPEDEEDADRSAEEVP